MSKSNSNAARNLSPEEQVLHHYAAEVKGAIDEYIKETGNDKNFEKWDSDFKAHMVSRIPLFGTSINMILSDSFRLLQ